MAVGAKADKAVSASIRYQPRSTAPISNIQGCTTVYFHWCGSCMVAQAVGKSTDSRPSME